MRGLNILGLSKRSSGYVDGVTCAIAHAILMFSMTKFKMSPNSWRSALYLRLHYFLYMASLDSVLGDTSVRLALRSHLGLRPHSHDLSTLPTIRFTNNLFSAFGLSVYRYTSNVLIAQLALVLSKKVTHRKTFYLCVYYCIFDKIFVKGHFSMLFEPIYRKLSEKVQRKCGLSHVKVKLLKSVIDRKRL